MFGGWTMVAILSRLVYTAKQRQRAREKARKAKVFKAAVLRTVAKATLASTLHKAAGLGSLQYRTREEDGQLGALTDEQAAEVANKMESVADKTMALLMGGGNKKTAMIEEAKEGVAAMNSKFRNAVMKRQMAKIAAASAFGGGSTASSATSGGVEAAAAAAVEGEGEEARGLLSLRERAAAAASAKGKEPETTAGGGSSAASSSGAGAASTGLSSS